MPEHPDEIRMLDWDAEVNVFDEDVPELASVIPPEVVPSFSHMDSSVAHKVLSVVCAAKLAWWSTQHHLGVRIEFGDWSPLSRLQRKNVRRFGGCGN